MQTYMQTSKAQQQRYVSSAVGLEIKALEVWYKPFALSSCLLARLDIRQCSVYTAPLVHCYLLFSSYIHKVKQTGRKGSTSTQKRKCFWQRIE